MFWSTLKLRLNMFNIAGLQAAFSCSRKPAPSATQTLSDQAPSSSCRGAICWETRAQNAAPHVYSRETQHNTPGTSSCLNSCQSQCEVLIAEEDLANSRLEECLLLLDTLHDAVDDAHTCAQEANAQISTVLNIVDQDNAPVDLSNATNCYKPTLLIWSQSPSFSESTPPLDADFSADFNFSPENPPNNPLDYEWLYVSL